MNIPKTLIQGFGKIPQGILRKSKYTRSLVFKTVCGIFLALLVALTSVK
jgi:hypothetical protein